MAEQDAIVRFVEAAWHYYPIFHLIHDDRTQLEAIPALRTLHKFPDIGELLGEPGPHHYTPLGDLTTARKAEFLLFGVFNWRGVKVTYQHGNYSGRTNKLTSGRWLAATEESQAVGIPPFETLRDFTYPSRRYAWRPFREVALELV